MRALLKRVFRDQRGLSLNETLIAVALVDIAIAGLMSTMSFAGANIDSGRRATTALVLAEQRAEQVKAFSVSRQPAQGFPNLTSTTFSDETYGGISGYAEYRRTVTVTDSPGGVANTKLIEVKVFYTPVANNGPAAETSTYISTLLTR
ncbi:MAG: hypothetical protein HYR86_12365 [Candidatus Rokubacteria bacterium]|nr:hypothetical protein [Candidatus Rokubacteria bacterium]